MHRGSATLSPRRTEAARERLLSIGRLASAAGLKDLSVVSELEAAHEEVARIVPGWGVCGGPDPARRQALAELASRIVLAEDEVESLCGEILERYEEAALVYRLGRQLATTLGSPSIARLFVESAVRSMAARAGEVWIREGERAVLVASAPQDVARPGELREQGPLSALSEGRPWVREASGGSEALVAIPLPGPEDLQLGVIVLRGREGGLSYRANEIKRLTALACLASALIRNQRLVETGREADPGVLHDGTVSEIHGRLHPDELAGVPGFDVAAGCRVAEGIAGDAFGCLSMRGGGLCVYVADLSRRGIAGALDLMTMRGALLAAASRASDCAEVLHASGAALAGEYARHEACATAVAVRLGRGEREIGWASAGHCPQLLARADRTVLRLEPSGPPLGALDELDYSERVLRLGPGDFLLLFTDALVDARDARGRAFGEDRLREAAIGCARTSAAGIRNSVLAEVYRHCGDNAPQDDMTVIVILAVETAHSESQP